VLGYFGTAVVHLSDNFNNAINAPLQRNSHSGQPLIRRVIRVEDALHVTPGGALATTTKSGDRRERLFSETGRNRERGERVRREI